MNVRVVAATHRDLEGMILENTFRSDLYYRLNVFPVYIPPLRKRAEDIPLLVWHFVRHFARQMNKTIDTICPATMETLVEYTWPGNIRELQNVIERAVIVHTTGSLAVLKTWLSSRSPERSFTYRRSAEEDREMIRAAVAEAKGRISGPLGAASRLGIPSSTLESKLKSLRIDKYRLKPAQSF